jgi:hypothetical protein
LVAHHVDAASLDFARSVPRSGAMGRVARWVLQGMYQAPQKYKKLNGANKCVLTVVGGGVFQNDTAWIVEAIRSCEELIVKTGLHMFLICFSPRLFMIKEFLR